MSRFMKPANDRHSRRRPSPRLPETRVDELLNRSADTYLSYTVMRRI